VSAVLVLACALGVLMLTPAVVGLDRYVITGASMGDAIPKGSIAYTRKVPVADLRVGDVITYTPPAGAGPGGRVTHRIVWVGRGASGARAFRTKGDANASPDPWKFELHRATQARVAGHVPYAGYPIAALSLRWVRMLVIGLPAALIALAMLAGLVADGRRSPAEVTE
jgi:signal peptidase